MTSEEQQQMIQALSSMLYAEQKERERLDGLVTFLTRPRLSEYDGLYRQIEEQQKTIDDQQETIESQKKALRNVISICAERGIELAWKGITD